MAGIRRGSFDPSLANHIENSPNKKRSRKKSRKATKEENRRKRVAEVRAIPYAEYLVSKHWRRKREEALQYHGRQCNRCRSVERLHVHHKTYDRLGCERIQDLEILCADCHAGEHQHEKPWIEDSLVREYIAIFRG